MTLNTAMKEHFLFYFCNIHQSLSHILLFELVFLVALVDLILFDNFQIGPIDFGINL